MVTQEKSLGDFARADIKHHHDKMKPGKGDTAEDLADRMYCMQMEIYSAYCGRDLHTPFWSLPEATRKQWIESAEEKMKKEKNDVREK